MTHETLLMDIGNTCIKVKHLQETESFMIESEATIDKLNNMINEKNINTIIMSSVNHNASDKLLLALQNSNVKIIDVHELLETQSIISFSNIQGMGDDRKLGLLGASMLFSSPVVVVDCGTAITISVLGNDNVCYGGTIMLGMSGHARALHTFTASLPRVKIAFKQNDLLLDNTQDAIQQGLISTTRGGIIDSLATIFYKVSQTTDALQDANIIFSGGLGSSMMALTRKGITKNYILRNYVKSIQSKYDLVLIGIERLQYLI